MLFFSTGPDPNVVDEMVACTVLFNIYFQRNNQTETSGTTFKMC